MSDVPSLGTTKDILDELRGMVLRRESLSTVPRFTQAQIRHALTFLRTTNASAVMLSPVVERAARRLLDCVEADALRLAWTPDVDTLLTFVNTLHPPQVRRGRVA